MSAFVREPRYLVLKVCDAKAALTAAECLIFNVLTDKVMTHRKRVGKSRLSGVFVEHDWPEYDMVWAAIEKRMAT